MDFRVGFFKQCRQGVLTKEACTFPVLTQMEMSGRAPLSERTNTLVS